MAKREGDLRFDEPPPGFVVLREITLDPENGREDRWLIRGIIEGRSIIRSGLRSRSAACRAAWFVYDDESARLGHEPDTTDVASVDAAVAEALARRHAVNRERDHETVTMRDWYRVPLDSWQLMTANLLWQIIADTGSLRRAAKIIDVPRSTLSRWVRGHRKRGTWPEAGR